MNGLKQEIIDRLRGSNKARARLAYEFDCHQETIQVLKDVLVKGQKQSEDLSKVITTLADNNEHFREEALAYRKILMDGYDAGLLQWVKSRK